MTHPDNKKHLTINDFSVSNESFDLFHDQDLDMLFTFPAPSELDLPKYYESEDYISHTDGKRSIFEKAYHFVKNIALTRKLNLVNRLVKEKGLLLDIGAGTGDFLALANRNGWKTIGTEPNQKAKATAIAKGVDFENDTSQLAGHSCDIITMWHVLEHVPNLEDQIVELKRLLKPNGFILIAVPNFKSYDAEYYREYWAAYDVPRHLWHFSKTAIDRLFAKENLKLIDVLPMKFDAFYVSLLSEKYKSGAMNPFKAFITGIRSNSKAAKSGEYSSHIYVIKNT